MPAYNGAVAALNALSKGDINEVKGYISPPALVRKVMEAVCFLLLGKLADWDAAKKVCEGGGGGREEGTGVERWGRKRLGRRKLKVKVSGVRLKGIEVQEEPTLSCFH